MNDDYTQEDIAAAREAVRLRADLDELRSDVTALERKFERDLPGRLSYDEQRVLVAKLNHMAATRPGFSDIPHDRAFKARSRLRERGLVRSPDAGSARTRWLPADDRFGDLTRRGARVAARIKAARGREFQADEQRPMYVRACTGNPKANSMYSASGGCLDPMLICADMPTDLLNTLGAPILRAWLQAEADSTQPRG